MWPRLCRLQVSPTIFENFLLAARVTRCCTAACLGSEWLTPSRRRCASIASRGAFRKPHKHPARHVRSASVPRSPSARLVLTAAPVQRVPALSLPRTPRALVRADRRRADRGARGAAHVRGRVRAHGAGPVRLLARGAQGLHARVLPDRRPLLRARLRPARRRRAAPPRGQPPVLPRRRPPQVPDQRERACAPPPSPPRPDRWSLR